MKGMSGKGGAHILANGSFGATILSLFSRQCVRQCQTPATNFGKTYDSLLTKSQINNADTASHSSQ